MYYIHATVGVEQQQMRLVMIATAAAGPSILYIDFYRGAHRIFIQELPSSIPEKLSDKHQRRGS